MVKIRYVSRAGGLMLARFDDGTRQTLYPTSGDMWMGSPAPVVVDPPPDPDPGTGGAWTHPLPGSTISSPYGPRNGSGGPPDPAFHAGTDFSTPKADVYGPGGNVVAPFDMVIKYAFEDGGAGLPDAGTYVKAWSASGTAYSFSFFHMHPGTLAVSAGQTVTAGTVIGVEGNSGNSFGSHLHFEIWDGHMAGDFFYWGDGTPVDPVPILNANGVTT